MSKLVKRVFVYLEISLLIIPSFSYALEVEPEIVVPEIQTDSLIINDTITETVIQENTGEQILLEEMVSPVVLGELPVNNDTSVDNVSVENNNVIVENDEIDLSGVFVEEEVPAVEEKIIENFSYLPLMREIYSYEKDNQGDKYELGKKISTFIVQEKDRVLGLNVSQKNKKKYLNFLRDQLELVDDSQIGTWDKVKSFFSDLFIEAEDDNQFDNLKDKTENDAIKYVDKPATFGFTKNDVLLEKLNPGKLYTKNSKIKNLIKDVSLIDVAEAYEDTYMPFIEDIQEDGQDIVITQEMRDLVEDFEYNPAEIYEYVKNTIQYEPYYGSKKGSDGCIEQKVCNDVDTASLTIALMRVAGIPARYHKSIVVASTDQLKDLLGVEEVKTVYIALHNSGIPVYTLDGDVIADPLSGQNINDVDMEGIQALVFEWVVPQIFIDYDEKGGNYTNLVAVSEIETTEALRVELSNYGMDMQWLPIEVLIKNYTHVQNEVVHDTAQFNTESFWYDFFVYQGEMSPVEKYISELQAQTSKDIKDEVYQSTNKLIQTEISILPPTTPYAIGEGSVGNTNYTIETWSIIPDSRKNQVVVRVLDADTNQEIISQTFFGTQIDNIPFDVYYEGSTQGDKDAIELYGGISMTPAHLVDITPKIHIGESIVETQNTVNIGQSLILEFQYIINGEILYEDQKFSTAGNNEGICVVLSQIEENHIYDDADDTNRESKVLLGGNSAIAREYIKTIQGKANLVEKSLDYNYNTKFSRAVVTENRVLNTVDGVPTTFDFSGLTVDATTYVEDYSRRGNYKNHQKDFRLLYGLEASYQEGQIFTTLTGLSGIATVQGLQYAYANPGEYTVYTIDAENEQVIDTLTLTENTKTLMHVAVQNGNTILTPNRMVEDGSWRGILFVSLDLDWTAMYAIGEQVQNGGFTKDGYQIINVNIGGEQINQFVNYGDTNNFVYSDGNANTKDKICRINSGVFLDIMNNYNWQEQYGLPCMVENLQFGTHDHKFVLTMNAGYFKSNSDGYEYWKREPVIRLDFQNAINDRIINVSDLKLYWGTYVTEYKLDNFSDAIAVYNPQRQAVYKISGGMAKKYTSGENIIGEYVPGLLGFPTGSASTASKYGFGLSGSSGLYQQFSNGTMYYKQGINGAFYTAYIVPGKLNEMHNNDGGTESVGFPEVDPQLTLDGTKVFQQFENGNKYTVDINNLLPVSTVNSAYIIPVNTDNETKLDQVVEGVKDAFAEYGVYGLAAVGVSVSVDSLVNNGLEKLTKRFGKKKVLTKVAGKFIPVLGWVLLVDYASDIEQQHGHLLNACALPDGSNVNGEGKLPSYYCGKVGVFAALTLIDDGFSSKGVYNKLGVFSKKARTGKDKLFNAIGDKYDVGDKIRNLLINNKKTANNFHELVDNLSDADVESLIIREDVSKRLIEDVRYHSTFSGFVHGGEYDNLVKYKVDPRYSSEFTLYSNPRNFDSYQTMLNNGITREGFFTANELDDAISIYNNMDPVNREIIFVTKLDGTTILTPRYKNSTFPHPVLSSGEDVLCAGTILPTNIPGKIEVANNTGHFKVNKNDMEPVLDELEKNFTVINKTE